MSYSAVPATNSPSFRTTRKAFQPAFGGGYGADDGELDKAGNFYLDGFTGSPTSR